MEKIANCCATVFSDIRHIVLYFRCSHAQPTQAIVNANVTAHGTGLVSRKSRYLTTRIHFGFPLSFKFINPAED